MGDFNAKVGHHNTGYEKVIGKHGYAKTNENEDSCENDQLVIGGTLPTQRHPQAYICFTWKRDRNQIDHIAINGEWKGLLQDKRVRRRADGESDHHQVTANIKLKLMKVPPRSTIKRYDIGKFDDKSSEHFKLEPGNEFLDIQSSNMEEESKINQHWAKVSDTFNKASEQRMVDLYQITKKLCDKPQCC